jgi:hypothetical protein
LQLASGLVENIGVTIGSDPYHVVLATAPSEDLVTDEQSVAKTLYVIAREDNYDLTACLVATKEYKSDSNFVSTVSAVNYDARYYKNDIDQSGATPIPDTPPPVSPVLKTWTLSVGGTFSPGVSAKFTLLMYIDPVTQVYSYAFEIDYNPTGAETSLADIAAGIGAAIHGFYAFAFPVVVTGTSIAVTLADLQGPVPGITVSGPQPSTTFTTSQLAGTSQYQQSQLTATGSPVVGTVYELRLFSRADSVTKTCGMSDTWDTIFAALATSMNALTSPVHTPYLVTCANVSSGGNGIMNIHSENNIGFVATLTAHSLTTITTTSLV